MKKMRKTTRRDEMNLLAPLCVCFILMQTCLLRGKTILLQLCTSSACTFYRSVRHCQKQNFHFLCTIVLLFLFFFFFFHRYSKDKLSVSCFSIFLKYLYNRRVESEANFSLYSLCTLMGMAELEQRHSIKGGIDPFPFFSPFYL